MMNEYRVLMSAQDRVGIPQGADRILDKTIEIRVAKGGEVYAFLSAIRRADEMLTSEQRAKVRSIECWYVAPVLRRRTATGQIANDNRR